MDNHLTGGDNIAARFGPGAFASAFEDSESSLGYESDEFVCPAFAIRAADSSGERSSASVLIERMYATRGYTSTPLPEKQPPHLMTLVASDHSATIGTLTVGFDSDQGLLADDLFGDEVEALRATGRQVCEFTKLAIDAQSQSRPVLAALFNVAYIYAYRIRGVDNLLIEVNPRHARYYAAMLGFSVIGPKRLNRRVNAPAVLLSLDFAHVRESIATFGGKPATEATERSLYPFSFSAREEAGIVKRLRQRFCEAPLRPTISATRRSPTPAIPRIPPSYSSAIHCA